MSGFAAPPTLSQEAYAEYLATDKKEAERHRATRTALCITAVTGVIVYALVCYLLPYYARRTVATTRSLDKLHFPPDLGDEGGSSADEPFVMVHVSDVHVRAASDTTTHTWMSVIDWASLLAPDAIVNTGDLIDGVERLFHRYQVPAEWAGYERSLRETGLITPLGPCRYVDTPGNHDTLLGGDTWADSRNLYRVHSATGPVLDGIPPGGAVAEADGILVGHTNRTYVLWRPVGSPDKPRALVRVVIFTSPVIRMGGLNIPWGYFGHFDDLAANELVQALRAPAPQPLCKHPAAHPTPNPAKLCKGVPVITFLASHHCEPMIVQEITRSSLLIDRILHEHGVHYWLCGHDHLIHSVDRLERGDVITLTAANTAKNSARVIVVDRGSVVATDFGYGQDTVVVTAPPSALMAVPDARGPPPGTIRVLVFDGGGAVAYGILTREVPTAVALIGNSTALGDEPTVRAKLQCRPRRTSALSGARTAPAHICEGVFDHEVLCEGRHFMTVNVTFAPGSPAPRTAIVSTFVTLNGAVAPPRRYAEHSLSTVHVRRSVLAGWGDHPLEDSWTANLLASFIEHTATSASASIEEHRATPCRAGELPEGLRFPTMQLLVNRRSTDLAAGEWYVLWTGFAGVAALCATLCAALPSGAGGFPATEVLVVIVVSQIVPALTCPWTGTTLGWSGLWGVYARGKIYSDPFAFATGCIVVTAYCVPFVLLRMAEHSMERVAVAVYYIRAMLHERPTPSGGTPVEGAIIPHHAIDEPDENVEPISSAGDVADSEDSERTLPLVGCPGGMCLVNIPLPTARVLIKMAQKVRTTHRSIVFYTITAFMIPTTCIVAGLPILSEIMGPKWAAISPMIVPGYTTLIIFLLRKAKQIWKQAHALAVWPPQILPPLQKGEETLELPYFW